MTRLPALADDPALAQGARDISCDRKERREDCARSRGPPARARLGVPAPLPGRRAGQVRLPSGKRPGEAEASDHAPIPEPAAIQAEKRVWRQWRPWLIVSAAILAILALLALVLVVLPPRLVPPGKSQLRRPSEGGKRHPRQPGGRALGPRLPRRSRRRFPELPRDTASQEERPTLLLLRRVKSSSSGEALSIPEVERSTGHWWRSRD